MIRKVLSILLIGASLSLPSWATAKNDQYGAPPTTATSGCPVVCNNFEACIENRCVETCRPGCRPGMTCTASGECIPVPQPKEPVLTEDDRQRLAGAQSADSTNLVFVDVGGVVGYGVQPGIEWGKQHSLVARLRLMNTGVTTNAAMVQNEFLRFEWGFGVSAAYRFYEARWGNLRGFYYGGGMEYRINQVTARGDPDTHQILHSVAPFGEFGYRWVFGDIVFGFGPTLGLRYPIASGFGALNSTSCSVNAGCEEAGKREFEGAVHIEVGWFQ